MRLFAWPRKPEQNKIVPRQERVGDLRQNGFFVPVNARKERLAGFELLKNVRAQLVLDGAARRSRRIAGKFSQFAERCRFRGHRGPLIDFDVTIICHTEDIADSQGCA